MTCDTSSNLYPDDPTGLNGVREVGLDPNNCKFTDGGTTLPSKIPAQHVNLLTDLLDNVIKNPDWGLGASNNTDNTQLVQVFQNLADLIHTNTDTVTGLQNATIKNNLTATTAPTVNDDSSSGYLTGSDWVDQTGKNAYKCIDHSVGAAIWKPLTERIAIITHTESNGVNAGPSFKTFTKRKINNLFGGEGFCAIDRGNYEFTLGAGTYYLECQAVVFAYLNAREQLYNVTDASIVKTSLISKIDQTSGAGPNTVIRTVFTITATKTFHFRHWGNVGHPTGLGLPSRAGVDEEYLNALIKKLA